MRLYIQHTTSYQYDEAMGYAITTVCLTPQSSPSQQVAYWDIKAPGKLFAVRDGFGNVCHNYSFVGQTQKSTLLAKGLVQTHGQAEWQDAATMPHPLFYLRSSHLSEPHARMADFAKPFVAGGVSVAALLELSQSIADKVKYKKNSTGVETTALEAFDWGAGVCQDQAHVMLAVCRSAGIPARYVSGYFYAANEPDMASHAWVDVCVDVQKRLWASIDVTHSCLMDERHVRIATGIDYSSCPPVKGVRHGGRGEAMQVDVKITPAI